MSDDTKIEMWQTLLLLDSFIFLTVLILLDYDLTLCLGSMSMSMYYLNVVKPTEVFVGFSNVGIGAGFFLFIVAGGLKETNAVRDLAKRYLANKGSEQAVNWALFPVVLVASSVSPNVILMVILLPVLQELYSIKHLTLHKTLMPLSYCIVLGSQMSFISNCVNLIAFKAALLLLEFDREDVAAQFKLQEVIFMGGPVAIVGLLYVLIFATCCLDQTLRKKDVLGEGKDFRKRQKLKETGYWVVFRVNKQFKMKNVKIRELGAEKIGVAELQAVIRAGRNYTTSEVQFLQENDVLVFIATADGIVHLRDFQGLELAVQDVLAKLKSKRTLRLLYECTISQHSKLNGHTLKAAKFRQRLEAVVICIKRKDEVVCAQNFADIVLKSGD